MKHGWKSESLSVFHLVRQESFVDLVGRKVLTMGIARSP
jgi:hypothetical protein